MADKKTTITFHGRMLSPGLASGQTFLYRDILTEVGPFYDISETRVEDELQRFERAVNRISADLGQLVERLNKEMDASLSEVFEAHIAMLQDPSLVTEVERQISGELVSAGSAVKTVFRRWERRLRAVDAEFSRQKGDDIHDLARRLVSSLAGVTGHGLKNLPHGSVLVANRLLPSDTIWLGRRKASAAVLEVGGAGSHAALFAHEIGLPCVSGLSGIVEKISSGALALVDADAGQVTINPSQRKQQAFAASCRRQQQAQKAALADAHKPALTEDGVRIAVLANVGSVDDTREAVANGAEGVGLYRIERAYLGRQQPPDSAELLAEMRATLEPARALPVYVRLLDIGADKPLPFLESSRESNPALGRRGIRFLHRYPELLRTQLQALLQLAADFDLHILVPMVTLAEDLIWLKQVLEEAASAGNAGPLPKLGAMIETPAAALAAAELAQHVDFFSVGSNDLTQYTFAADRENTAVDRYFDDSHPVIFRLLKMVHDDVPEMPLSVCGELASRADYTAQLLACGVTSVSVAPPSVATIKQAIRQTRKAP